MNMFALNCLIAQCCEDYTKLEHMPFWADQSGGPGTPALENTYGFQTASFGVYFHDPVPTLSAPSHIENRRLDTLTKLLCIPRSEPTGSQWAPK